MEIIKLTYRYTPKSDTIVPYELQDCLLRLFCNYKLTLPVSPGSLDSLLPRIKPIIKKGADKLTANTLHPNTYSYSGDLLQKIVDSGPLHYAGPCDTYVKSNLLPIHATKYSSQKNLVSGEVQKIIRALHVLSDKYTMSEIPPKLPVLKSYASAPVHNVPYFSLDNETVYFKIPSKMLYLVEQYSSENLVDQNVALAAERECLESKEVEEDPW